MRFAVIRWIPYPYGWSARPASTHYDGPASARPRSIGLFRRRRVRGPIFWRDLRKKAAGPALHGRFDHHRRPACSARASPLKRDLREGFGGVLRHIADIGMFGPLRRARVRRKIATQYAQQRGFSRAVLANDGDFFARLNRKIKLLE